MTKLVICKKLLSIQECPKGHKNISKRYKEGIWCRECSRMYYGYHYDGYTSGRRDIAYGRIS